MSLVSYLEKYYNSCIPQNVPVPETCASIKINTLRHLVIALKQYESDFYNAVLNSDGPNFLITSYYSLYLRFLEVLYSELEVLEQSVPDRDIDIITETVNSVVAYFGTPILRYLTRKEVPPNISDLAGILLHVLISTGKQKS
jgi:hypothetical protein